MKGGIGINGGERRGHYYTALAVEFPIGVGLAVKKRTGRLKAIAAAVNRTAGLGSNVFGDETGLTGAVGIGEVGVVIGPVAERSVRSIPAGRGKCARGQSWCGNSRGRCVSRSWATGNDTAITNTSLF